MECLETSILGTTRRWLPVPHSPAKVYKFRTYTMAITNASGVNGGHNRSQWFVPVCDGTDLVATV